MSESIVDFILHYKKSIEKNCEDRERVLHCLTRLAKLKVSVNHLQLTGIGKTVNYVKKFDGEVGELARRLVSKWKDMVAESEKAEKPPVPLFKLPIKLEPEEFNSPSPTHEDNSQQLKKSSSSSSSSSEPSRNKHHHSSRNDHSIKSEKKSDREDNQSHSNKKSSETKHHKSHHHSSRSSQSDITKRKREDHSTDSKENDLSLKKPKLENDEIKKESSSSSPSKKSKSNHHHHSKSSSNHKESASSSTSSKSKEKPTKKKSSVEDADEEVDGSQGMGFAEALALFDMPSSSKKKDLHLADKIVKVPSTSGSTTSKSSSKSSREKDEKKSTTSSKAEEPKKSLKSLTAPPKLLTQKPKLKPLPDIVNDLPSDVSIPDYRPLPLSSAVKDYINSSSLGASYMKPQKHMSDTDLLTESFSSKANRTKVYSGNRIQKTVPALFEMCIRVLQENIEFLETTGGVPFDILRPVLERAKPEHLNSIEYYNPYLLDESDVLWEPHCKRKFRTKKRLEMESWREMYERCTREDEEKLNRLTQNIKQREETTSSGVQKTMLAFVDSMVKPPRNVMRKQEIFGTNKKLVVSPAARTVGLKNMMPNLAAAGDARLRIAAGIRDDAHNMVGRGMQRGIKKAPMMAKILSKFKR